MFVFHTSCRSRIALFMFLFSNIFVIFKSSVFRMCSFCLHCLEFVFSEFITSLDFCIVTSLDFCIVFQVLSPQAVKEILGLWLAVVQSFSLSIGGTDGKKISSQFHSARQKDSFPQKMCFCQSLLLLCMQPLTFIVHPIASFQLLTVASLRGNTG